MGQSSHQLAEGSHLFTLDQLRLGSLKFLQQLGQLLVLRFELNIPQAVNLRFVSAPFSLKTDLEITNLGTGFFAKYFLAQAMEDACMLQRGSQLAIPLVDFRKELVGLIGLGLGTNLFSNGQRLADCVERFSTVAALEVKATQVQKT